jgi:hypothetical protein
MGIVNSPEIVIMEDAHPNQITNMGYILSWSLSFSFITPIITIRRWQLCCLPAGNFEVLETTVHHFYNHTPHNCVSGTLLLVLECQNPLRKNKSPNLTFQVVSRRYVIQFQIIFQLYFSYILPGYTVLPHFKEKLS